MQTYCDDAVSWVMQKLNGHWLQVARDAQGVLHATTRSGRDITDKVQRQPFWGRLVACMPSDTVVEGELHKSGGTASDVTRLLPKGHGLSFHVFTLPTHRGADMRGIPWATIAKLVNEFATFIEGAPFDPTEDYLDVATDNGWEGVVMWTEHAGTPYKLKPVLSADLLISGTVAGRGRLAGAVGAVMVTTLDGIEVARVGSGFDDNDRDEIEVGRIIEVEYQGVGAGGRLLFPRFVQWRDDKLAGQCTATSEL